MENKTNGIVWGQVFDTESECSCFDQILCFRVYELQSHNFVIYAFHMLQLNAG